MDEGKGQICKHCVSLINNFPQRNTVNSTRTISRNHCSVAAIRNLCSGPVLASAVNKL